MSSIGSSSISTGPIQPLDTPAATDTASAASAASTAGTPAPGSSGARAGVMSSLTPADLAHEIPGTSAAIRDDGAIMPLGSAVGGPLAAINELALRPADTAGPFDGVTSKTLLGKVADRLLETHQGLTKDAPDEATSLAWRQSRGASLHLLEQAAMRAMAMGDAALCRKIIGKTLTAIQAEPWRQVRDFAFESIVSRTEAGSLPEVVEAREALYPSKPPYEKWLADGKIDIQLYCDDDGSPIKNQIEFFTKQLGFKHTENADGSHSLVLEARGNKPPVHITIPKKDGEPRLFEKMDDDSVDVIAYTGHAGYGHRVDAAIADGVGGTGEDKLVVLFQCWGEGNIESLARTYPDARLLSTTDATHDGLDWVQWFHMIRGFQGGDTYEAIHGRTVPNVVDLYGSDSEYKDKDWQNHFFNPTSRSILVNKYDRDGDGTVDSDDHIFNVIYPKRVDAAGGYDPVVQPVPPYALDGSQLTRSVTDFSLAVRYNAPFEAALADKLPWKPELWQPGGFFTPADGDNRAFQFTKGPDGKVSVALSTKFSHTQQEDLSRMLAFEAGLWVADEAGMSGADKLGVGVALAERIVHQQGAWYGTTDNVLDEPWAEESLFMERYGLSGFTFGELETAIGDAHDYTPAQFAKVLARVKDIPDADTLAERAPTRIGEPIDIGAGLALPDTYFSQAEVKALLERMGIEGNVLSYSPGYLAENQATNVVILCEKGGNFFQISLGVDSERKIQAATRLDLDLSKKVDAAGVRVLESLVTEGDDSLTAAQARAPFQAARVAGKPIGEALAVALRAIRDRVPPGKAVDAYAFHELERSGMITPADATAVREATERFFGATHAETTIFSWIESVGPDAGVDVGAVKAAYSGALQRAGGGSEGRAAALEAALRLLPDDMGFAGGGGLETLLATPRDSRFLPAAEQDRLALMLRGKVSKDLAGLIEASLSEQLADVLQNYGRDETPEGKAALNRAVAAVGQAVRGGADLVTAAPDILRAFAYEVEADLPEWTLEQFARSAATFGVLAEADVVRLAGALQKVSRETTAAATLVAAVRGDMDPLTDTTWAEIKQALGLHGDEFLPAAAAVLKARGANDLSRLREVATALEPAAAEQAAALEQLLEAVGETQAGLTRADLVGSLAEGREWDGLNAAAERDALAAFDGAVAAGAQVGDAVVAAAASVMAGSSNGEVMEFAGDLLGSFDVPVDQSGRLPQVAAALQGLDQLRWMSADTTLNVAATQTFLTEVVRGRPVGEALATAIRGLSLAGDDRSLAVVVTLTQLKEQFPADGAALVEATLAAFGKTEAELVGSVFRSACEDEDERFAEPAAQAFAARIAAGASTQDAILAGLEAAAAAVPADEAVVMDMRDYLRPLATLGVLEGAVLQAKLIELSPLSGEQVSGSLSGFAEGAGAEPAVVEAVRTAVAAAASDPEAQLAALTRELTGRNVKPEGSYSLGLGQLSFLLERIPADRRVRAVGELLSALGTTRGGAVAVAIADESYAISQNLKARLASGEPLDTALPLAMADAGVAGDWAFLATLTERGLLP